MKLLTIAVLLIGSTVTAAAQTAVYPDLPSVQTELMPLAKEQGWAVEVATVCDRLSMDDGLIVLMHLQNRAARRFDKPYSERVSAAWGAGDALAKANLADDRAGTCRKAVSVRPKVETWRKAAIRWRDGE